jgi:hypothetical protein
MFNFIKPLFHRKYTPGPGVYLDLCPDAIIKELNIKKRAITKGAINQPDSNDKSRDDLEQEVISKIHSFAHEAQQRTLEHYSTYMERVKSLNNSGVATDMMAIARRSEANMRSEILCINGELTQARREAIERANTLKDFRERNKLTRPADPAKNKFLLFSLLLVLFMIETFPSAMLLAGGSDFGILGGYTLAVTFSFLNLAMGFIMGRYACAFIIHKSQLIKIFGVVTFCALMTSIISLNLLLSHFRSIVESGVTLDKAAILSITKFITSPFGLQDLSSITMASLGILFSFFSMLEGWIWDEPYLGYGSVTKNSHDAESNYNALLNEKVANLKNVEIIYIEELESARSSLRDRRFALPRVAQELDLLMKKYHAHIRHLQDVGNSLLKKYYAYNKSARTTPAPKHFDQEWVLEGFVIEPINSIDECLSDTALEKVDKALTDSIERLQSAYEKSLRWIESLTKSEKLS